MPGTLLLIDAQNLAHRAFWGIQAKLTTSAGEEVNAVYGVASMVLTFLVEMHPDAVVACFDAGEETFRHQEYKEYKAGRAETPETFYLQLPRIWECLGSFGIPCLADRAVEADDLLGTLAAVGERQGWSVTIISGDRDVLQLVSPSVRVAVPKGAAAMEVVTPEVVQERYGVDPAHLPDYKGLTGDSSDNLPGVKGIGPVTAAKLLRQHHTLEALYAALREVSPKIRSKLEEGKEAAFFTRRMATIRRDVLLPLSLEEARLVLYPARVQEFLSSMEFTTLRKRFQNLLSDPYVRSRVPPFGGLPAERGGGETSQLDLFV